MPILSSALSLSLSVSVSLSLDARSSPPPPPPFIPAAASLQPGRGLPWGRSAGGGAGSGDPRALGPIREKTPPPTPPDNHPPAGLDVPNLKKRGDGTRSWIRVEAATASVQTLEIDKATMMRRCELPARDLRLLDPLFVYPSTVLGRERAIVVNLEQIRCVITADEVLLLNSLDSYVLQYAAELQRRLLQRAEGDELPFESRALELALEAACSFLDA